MLFFSSLAILNQALKHKSLFTKIPYNKKGYDLIKLLYRDGYLDSYYLDLNNIYVNFKSYQNRLVLNGFFFYSRPSHFKTISFNQLRRVYKKKNKLYILSTPNGICTTVDALQMHVGGLIIAEIK